MGLEWNLAVNAQLEPFTFQEALEKFMRNFYHDQTNSLTENVISAYEREYQNNRQKYPEILPGKLLRMRKQICWEVTAAVIGKRPNHMMKPL